jgi:K+-sensing histidine kinase KdpD
MMLTPRTAFAPAQRFDRDTVSAQANRVRNAENVAAVLDAVNIPVFVLNRYRQIVHANEPFYALMGVDDPESVQGLRQGEAFGCIGVQLAKPTGGCGTGSACRTCEAIRAVLNAQAHGKDERQCVFKLTRGNAMNAQFRATRVDIEGEVFIICALLDIRDSLWQRDIQHSFLHDILNIAGAIQTSSEALPQFNGARQKDYIDLIQSACDTLVNEIRSHRIMMQAEDGSLQAEVHTVRSLPFLQSMVQIVNEHRVGQDRSVVIASDSVDANLDTDRGLLSRVLVNLIKNALEASDPGMTVTARTDVKDGWVTFSVHNMTVIPDQVVHRIFARFFSTKGSGRGIGTYSARLLTEQYLGGSIAFTTDPDAGTTFTVSYPARPEAANRSA